ncbi:CIA30 family protein [Deinococcus sp. Arct2-2]|uniref:CIA30 family protein n=1 Tax=Deinococcus sp. Arct2-2 TaxID=2568653 RepID=UPI0010A4CF31|nr:CIA30 family protein [Deinococcus sp. Arct2-2]THF70860.1 CIA30 family protein [Deinococcus sp. Arct2-2]
MKRLALAVALLSSAALSGTLLDFQSREPAWYARNDTVMGGVSNSRVQIGGGVLQFTGQVRLENNGGFSGIRSNPSRFDLSQFSSLRLRVKGDGKRYALQLGTSTSNGVTYRNEFNTVAGRWIEVTIPLNSLRPTRSGERVAGPTLDSSKIIFFGLVIGNNRAERFALEVDWIKGQ